MSRVCEYCGKKTTSGRTIARRGMAKKKGGIGKKTTGINKRKFKPNIQKIKIGHGGGAKRVKICTKCLRTGIVQKPSLIKQKQT